MAIKSKITQKTLKTLEKITEGKLTLGTVISAIRQANGVSQVEGAEKLGISKQHLCNIEHDRKVVSPILAASYAKKLGYSQEQFIRLALQDMMDREGLAFTVEVTPKKHKRQDFSSWVSV